MIPGKPLGLSGHAATEVCFFFSLKKQTKNHNMGDIYTQGEFQPMFLFGNGKREKATLQIKVKPCVLKFLFKEKYWV